MADAPEKNWWRWFEKDTLISIVSALGLDVIFNLIKKEGPQIVWSHVTGNLKEKILTDKRAEIVREFRKMENAGINIDNLRRRHAEAMDRSKVDRWAEYRFVQLLCKIQPPDPANPQKVRPPIAPGTPGKPQNDRQADLKWLNDQGNPGDPRFDQMMHFLDHDVITQLFQVGYDRIARFLKNLWSELKAGWTNLTRWMHTHLGPLGDWLIATAEATRNLLVRFFRGLSGSWLRVVAVAVISLPILIFVALIVGPIRRRVFPWFGIAIGVLLVTTAYYLLVPTSLDKTLARAFLMLLVAAFFLRKFALVRKLIFGFLVLFTLIFFLGGRTAAWSKWVGIQEKAHAQEVNNLQAQIAARDQELAALHKREGEAQKVALQPPANTEKPDSGADGASPADSLYVPPKQVAEQACATLPKPIEYGEFTFVLTHCSVRGNQVRLSGNVQYGGQEKTNMYFHPFKAYDAAGDVYIVQDGRFGDSENFGLGHSGQWMYPRTSVPFSFELGPKDGSLPPATAITLVMPCSDQLGSQIVLQLALK
jgi:hypothetical protein